jgi:hypothetical protein
MKLSHSSSREEAGGFQSLPREKFTNFGTLGNPPVKSQKSQIVQSFIDSQNQKLKNI